MSRFSDLIKSGQPDFSNNEPVNYVEEPVPVDVEETVEEIEEVDSPVEPVKSDKNINRNIMDNKIKWFAITAGTLFGVAHIGVMGHLMNKTSVPDINLPLGEYSSYVIRAGEDGYVIEYKANDPKVMTTTKEIQKTGGLFGIGSRTEIQTFEQYTMDGARHTGGESLGKMSAKTVECIEAAGGGKQTGRMVGASLGSAAASYVTGIPYIGWVVAGWMTMFGQDKGSEIGADIATTMSDCDIELNTNGDS